MYKIRASPLNLEFLERGFAHLRITEGARTAWIKRKDCIC